MLISTLLTLQVSQWVYLSTILTSRHLHVPTAIRDQPRNQYHPKQPLMNCPSLLVTSLLQIKTDSCLRKSFCAKLTRELFTEEEMKTSNVRGVLGKKQLKPGCIQYIKNTAYSLYPLEVGEKADDSWRSCIKAIDEACRRLNRKY